MDVAKKMTAVVQDNESDTLSALDRVQAIIEFQLDGTVLTANRNFLETLGYSLEEISGKHHRIFCGPETTNNIAYKQFWDKLGRGEADTGEYKRYAKDGSEIWINASYNPIFDQDGKPYKVVKFATNITANKTKNAEFEGKIRAIERAQAVIEFKLDGSILSANENFLSTVGYSLEEIEGKHHRMFCDSDYTATAAYKSFWEQLASGEFASGRFKRMGKGGKVVWIQASYNPIFDSDGRPVKVVKFASDITLQVEVEDTVTRMATEIARDISEKSTDVAQGAKSLAATAEEMNATVEALTSSINSIADNSREADSIAKSTHREAEEGTKAIQRAIEAMDLISKSSEEISEIVKVISEIASQTNLLAFNAAIEAARAGEHGLGFSVVADEVRKLAERSSQATKEISKLINESVKRIAQGSEISKQAGEAFHKIVSGVNKTTQSISEISSAADVQLMSAKEVSTAIHQVAMETEKSAFASEGIANASCMLMQVAEDLKKTVDRFKAR